MLAFTLLRPIIIQNNPVTGTLEITASAEKNDHSWGNEVRILSIIADGKLLPLESAVSGVWQMDGDMLAAYNVEAPETICFTDITASDIELTVVKQRGSGYMDISFGDISERFDLYSDNDWQRDTIKFSPMDKNCVPRIDLFLELWVLFWAACVVVINKVSLKDKQNSNVLERNFLEKAIYIIFYLVLIPVTIFTIFFNSIPNFYVYKGKYIFVAICLFVCFCAVFWFMERHADDIRQCRWIWLIPAVIVFLQGIYVYYACSTGWTDVSTVSSNMIEFAKTGIPLNSDTKWYYQSLPNNLACTFIYGLLLKAVNALHDDPYFLLACINAVLTDISGVLLYIACKRICNAFCAVFCCSFFLCLMGFSHILVTPYTDTLGMFFTLLILNAYLRYMDQDILSKRRFFWLFAIGILSAFAFFIKPTVFILSIAIILSMLFFRGQASGLKQRLIAVAIFVMITAITAASARYFLRYCFVQDMDYSNEHNVLTFLLIGLSENDAGLPGVWNAEELKFFHKFDNLDGRSEACIRRAYDKLKERGILGSISFFWKKLVFTFEDGSFWAGGEGNGIGELRHYSSSGIGALIQRFLVPGGEGFHFFQGFAESMWLLLLFLIAFGIVFERASQNRVLYVIQLAVIGLMLYQMLFETRSRYLVIFLPLFCILASRSFYNLCKSIRVLIVSAQTI